MAIDIPDDMAIDMDNMDDLFGDSTAGLLPESNPPPRELLDRVEELRSSGCHQSVVWSRQGCIASINSNGCLELHGLRVDPRDGSWGLSEPTLVPHVGTSSLAQVPLQHLSWSPNGYDLAAIDAAGRVAIFNAFGVRNTAQPCRNVMQDSIDELRAIVGSMWLNMPGGHPKYPVLHTMAVKTSSQGYRYESVTADAFGPSYPTNQTTRAKSALVCVTITGLIRLFWAHDQASWRETNAELEGIVSSDELITHASMCADKDRTILLAYATSTKQLRVVRIAMQWAMPPMPQPNSKEQIPHQALPLKPPTGVAITVTHLASTNWMDSNTENSHLSLFTPALSHLKMLSPCRTGRPDNTGLPTVLSVRTVLPNNVPFYQEINSLVDRWEIESTTPQIHPAFQQLSARRDSVGSKKTTLPTETFFLKKLEGTSSKKVITWIDTIQLDRILVLGHDDGSLELRFRDSFNDITNEGGLDRFCHLTQAGFNFGNMEPSMCGAISPSGLVTAYKTSDGKLKWKGLLYTGSDMDSAQADTHYEAFIAGLTMPTLREIMISASFDDVLAVASQFKALQGRNLASDLVAELGRNSKVPCDWTEHEHTETLLLNPAIPIFFGFQLSLGYRGEGARRDFGSTIAWLILQLRFAVNMMVAPTREYPVPDRAGRIQKRAPGMADPDTLREIVGTVRYALDVMAYITDSLIHPNDSSEFDETFKELTLADPVDLKALNDYLYSTQNVAVHLLLSSTARGILMATCKMVHKLDHTARLHLQRDQEALAASSNSSGAPPRHLSTSLRSAFETIAHLTNNSVVPYQKFHEFVIKSAGHCKEAYAKAGLAGLKDKNIVTQRNTIEQQIIFGAPLPEQSAYAISKLFREDLPALKEDIDLAKLFFYDYSVLNMPLQDRGTILPYTYLKATDLVQKEKLRQRYVRYRVKHTVDVVKRKMVELGNEPEQDAKGNGQKRMGRKWRRCARCGAVMEEVQSRNMYVMNLFKSALRCHCMGHWNLMEGKKVVP